MEQRLTLIADSCDAINEWTGRTLSWLSLFAVLLMCVNVFERYFFNSGSPWQIELVLFFHAAAFLGAMGYTLKAGEQVRVDVFYARFPPRAKAWVNLLGTLLLLLPLCVLLIWFSCGFVHASWSLYEGSSEYNGLKGIFLLKTFLLIGPVLLMIQGLSLAIRSWLVLRHKEAAHG